LSESDRRRLSTNKTGEMSELLGKQVDMSSLLIAFVKRGDQDSSAEPENLAFNAILTDYTPRSLFIKLDF